MNHLKKLYLLVCCLSAVALSAQVTNISIETFYVDNNTITGYPDGHTTYRVYANCTSATDVVSTVYGDIYSPMTVSVSSTIWNTAFGGTTGPAINGGFCAVFPEVCLDSFVTIGRENVAAPGGSIFTLESPGQPWISNFAGANAGNDFTLDDAVGGAWFGLPGDVNCFAGGDLKVLLMQITTNGTLTISANLQVFPDWQIPGDPYLTQTGLFATTAAANGCTDMTACNYDPVANIDDGSCDYSCQGCTDMGACNYDAAATQDDGSCDYSCLGCTNALACNYDLGATINDGSCTFPGCIDMAACNYNPAAGCTNGSCTYGCAGCTDPLACNYLPGAGTDDGSCDYSCYGCTDMDACNYDATSTIDDGNCDYACIGCTDSEALNYDAIHTIDDGTCLFECDLNELMNELTDPTCSYGNNGSIYVHMMGAQGNYLYSINGGPFTNLGMEATFNNLANGIYTIVVRDSRFDDLAIDPNNVYGTCIVTLQYILDTPAVNFCQTNTIDASCPGAADGCASDECWTGGNGLVGFTIYNATNDQVLTDTDGIPLALASPSFCGLAAGTYYWVAADANLCTFTSSDFTIGEPEAVMFGMLMTTDATCSYSTDGCATAMLISSGVGPVTYTLHNAANNQIVSGNPLNTPDFCGVLAGMYYWMATDSNGCTYSSNDFEVSSPDAIVVCDVMSSDVSCNSGFDGCASLECVSGGTSPYTFGITDSNTGLPVLDDQGNVLVLNNPDYCGLMAGEYHFEVMDANGCMANSLDFIIGQPEPIEASLMVTDISCNGEADGTIMVESAVSIECSIDGGETWSTDCIYSDLGPGAYTILIEDANGCQLELYVSLTDPDELAATGAITNVSCADGSDGEVEINATGGTEPYTYTLGGNTQSSNVFGELSADSYDWTVTDDHGCTVSGNLDISEPSTLVIEVDETGGDGGQDAGYIDVTITGGTAPYDYLWTDDNGNEYTDEDLNDLGDGEYTLCVTDDNGCETCLTNPVEIFIGIGELENSMIIQANPNPSNGVFRINFEGLTGDRLELIVHDATGRIVYNENAGIISGEWIKNLDLSIAASGIYQLNAISGNHTKTLKLVIQK